MVNGRETLRLRSKGAATVQEVVSFTRSAGQWLLNFLMYSDSATFAHEYTDTQTQTEPRLFETASYTAD